tara:strand:- start:351 stop:530 length:180 start_codon:yes stop_codon:yes gene_type:complete
MRIISERCIVTTFGYSCVDTTPFPFLKTIMIANILRGMIFITNDVLESIYLAKDVELLE